MSAYVITRQSILDGTLLAAVKASLGPGQRLMSDAERQADIQRLLEQTPGSGDVWVFAFGSLIWNPAFEFIERRTARIHGWRRAFCLWNKAGRGSPDSWTDAVPRIGRQLYRGDLPDCRQRSADRT